MRLFLKEKIEKLEADLRDARARIKSIEEGVGEIACMEIDAKATKTDIGNQLRRAKLIASTVLWTAPHAKQG